MFFRRERLVEIRPYRPQTDFRGMVDAQCDLYQSNFPRFVCTHSFLADQGQRLKTAARRPFEHGIFVLDDSGTLGGFVWVAIRMDLQGAFGSIDQVYLFPAYRHQGWGRRLLDAAEQFLKERGVHYARLYVTQENAEAVHLYENSGYDIIRYEMEKPLD